MSAAGARRTMAAVVMTVAVLGAAGCSAGSATTGAPAAPDGAGTIAPVETTTAPVEEEGPPPSEEPGGQELPAEGGDGRVSIELAGLPAGPAAVDLVDGAWCGQLAGGGLVPEGASVDTTIHVRDPGVVVRDGGCGELPACDGATFAAGESIGCGVLIEAPPDVDQVALRLDGTLRCPDQDACDTSDLPNDPTFWIAVTSPEPEVGDDVTDDVSAAPIDDSTG